MSSKERTGERTTRYSDVVGLCLGADAVFVLRASSASGHLQITGHAERSPIRLPIDPAESCDYSIALPKTLSAPYAAFAVEHPQGFIRLISLKKAPRANDPDAVNEIFGGNPPESYRVGFGASSTGEEEGAYLACGLPDFAATAVARLLPEGRRPAPASLQIAAAARLNAFALLAAGASQAGVAYIYVEDQVTSVAVFNGQRLAVHRQFQIGNGNVLKEVARQFGLSIELANDLLQERQIDTSSAFNPILTPLFRQIGLSIEFVARREPCTVEKVFIGGKVSGIDNWINLGKSLLRLEVAAWDPFAEFQLAAACDAEELRKPGYDSALGAALSLLESA